MATTVARAAPGTDWSSLWKKDDWWAVWVGFAVLLLGIAQRLPAQPNIAAKWTSIAASLPKGASTIGPLLLVLAFSLVLTLIAEIFIGNKVRRYIAGFCVVFGLAFIATWLGKNATITKWGLEAVLWALILGLVIGNVFRVPDWLKAGAQTEFFIKIGLVLLGAEILFSTLVKGGAVGIAQALLVVIPVWFVAYWLARRFKLDQSFSSVMASGVSICGVSAAIAAGGAIKGNPKHVSHVISLVLLIAMPMLVAMPIVAREMGLPPNMAGAWVGGTIDTTGAVVAAGTVIDPKIGMQVASLVKLSQNVLIGFAAFFLAIWSALAVRKETNAERPRAIEIWYRFPKFILGFVLASVLLSVVVEPALGSKTTAAVVASTTSFRSLFFALAFVSIGLETRFKDLVAVGRGRPLMAFVSAQAFNIVWTLVIVWLLWSGTFFVPPIG